MNRRNTIPLPKLAIISIVLVYSATNFYHHNWTRDKGPQRGVIQWDVISYYAYLPAAFIYHDMKLDFVNEPGFNNDNKIWFTGLENGERLIITSMGLSIMYCPFFFMAHALAPVFDEPRSGYNSIYQFFLVFSAMVYVTIGLILLSRILLKWFSPLQTAICLLAVGLGTNLYHYTSFSAALPHSYNFFLITLFLYLVIRWYEAPDWKGALFTGLVFGLISLIRPSNILVFIVLFFWGVSKWSDLTGRIGFYLHRIPLVILMLAAFCLVWIPQLLYWKLITGQYLFYSYGPHGGNFYFDHPHLVSILFSYKKGWFVYTPVMLLAVVGIPFLRQKIKDSLLPVALILILMIYLQASWWSWWFGGCFGSRVFVDIYGLMALPLAALIDYAWQRRSRLVSTGFTFLLVILILFQIFQTFQYYKGAIHWMGMNREAYWETFLKMKTTGRYWNILTMPDPILGRLGIYVYYSTGEDVSYLENVEKEEALSLIHEQILTDKDLVKDIKRYVKREDISLEEALDMVANRIFEYKTNQ